VYCHQACSTAVRGCAGCTHPAQGITPRPADQRLTRAADLEPATFRALISARESAAVFK
jgi:hypothetical protein